MLRNYSLGLLLFLLLVGCGKDEQQVAASPGQALKVAARDENLGVSLTPAAPVSGDCVMVVVKGQAPDSNISWFLNDQQVQSGNVGQYCLPEASRGKVLRVVLGKSPVGPSVSVTIENAPPQVLDTGMKLVVEERQRFLESVPVAKDPDGDEVTLNYKWYINGELNQFENGGRLDIGDIKKGDLVKLEIVPSDGFVEGVPYSTAESPVPGSPPLIVSRPPKSFRANQFTYQVKAQDPDGDPLEFSLEDPPQGAAIDSQTGTLTWRLSDVAAGEYRISIVVTDSEGLKDTQSFPLNVFKDTGN